MNFYEDPTPTPFVTVGNTGSYQPQLQQPTKSQGGQAVSHLVDAHVAYIKTISDLNNDKAELIERIKRLEEAGDAVAAIIGPPGSAHWADENQVDAAWNNWRKAKEAKL